MKRPIHLQIATVVELHHQITPPQTQPQKQQIQPPLQHLNVGGVLVPKRVPTHHAHGNSPTSRQNTSSRSTARSRTRRGTVKDQSTTINAQEHSSPSSARGTRQRARSGGSSSSPASSSSGPRSPSCSSSSSSPASPGGTSPPPPSSSSHPVYSSPQAHELTSFPGDFRVP